MRTGNRPMNTQSEPNKDPIKTYSQTEAAAAAGVTQRALADRGKKQGYLSKLNYCFPGQFWRLVAVGSIGESRLRLTHKGVKELKELIQNLSPEPPHLDDNREPIRENGAVLKLRLNAPRCTLAQYAESVWFLNKFDGKGEHQRIELKELRSQDSEKISQETVEAELVDSGEIISVSSSSGSSIEHIFEALEVQNSNFWSELDRRRKMGKLRGRLLASAELEAQVNGELELQTEFLNQSKKVASQRKTPG